MGEDRNGDPLTHETPTIIRPKGPNYRGAMICFSGVVVISLVGMARALLESNSIIYALVTMAILFAVAAASIARLRVELRGDEMRFTGILRRARTLRLDQIASARGALRSAGYLGLYTPLLVIEPVDPRQRPMTIPTLYFTHADVNLIRNFLGERLKRRPSRSGR
jgi:hypothetical protein